MHFTRSLFLKRLLYNSIPLFVHQMVYQGICQGGLGIIEIKALTFSEPPPPKKKFFAIVIS